MKKIFLMMLSVVWLPIMMVAQDAPTQSAYYNFPEGAFATGVNETSGLLVPNIYMPYSSESRMWKSITGAGDWYTNGKNVKTGEEIYNSKYDLGYIYYIPELRETDYVTYQYGSKTTSSTAKRVYGGTASMAYLTPAKLWCDEVQSSSGQALILVESYKSSNSTKFGVCFNNTDVMYIDEIIIPITANNSSKTVDDLFPNSDSEITLTIYPATVTKNSNGSFSRTFERKNVIYTTKLDKTNFNVNSSNSGRGGLCVNLSDPLSITGAFVIELSDLKSCGEFYFYSDKNTHNTSKWSHYVQATSQYTSSQYTLAFTVHAMFPALYKDDEDVVEVEAPVSGGACVALPIHSNVDPANFTIDKPDWVTSCAVSYTDADGAFKASAISNLTFTAAANTSTESREGTITLNNRGKIITYTIKQAGAPAINLMTEDGENVAGWVNFGTKTLAEEGSENYTGSKNYSLQVLNFTEDATVSVGVENDEVDAFTASYDATSELVTVSYNVLSTASGAYKSQLSVKVTDKDNNEYQTTFPISLDVNATGETTALENIEGLDRNAPMYNVLGMQVDANYKGIVIQEGKKFMLQ